MPQDLQEAIEKQSVPAINLDPYFMEAEDRIPQKVKRIGILIATEKALQKVEMEERRRLDNNDSIYPKEGFRKELNTYLEGGKMIAYKGLYCTRLDVLVIPRRKVYSSRLVNMYCKVIQGKVDALGFDLEEIFPAFTFIMRFPSSMETAT